MLKSAITLTSAATLLALAACNPPHPHVRVLRAVSALDCPDSQGDLNRRAQASDGKSCDYADDEGNQVSLRLIALNGQDPGAALAPLEAGLKSELPAPPGGAAASTDGGKDRVDIDLPGIHIHAKGDNDAKVDLGGVRINAPEQGVHGAGDSVTINSQGASPATRFAVQAYVEFCRSRSLLEAIASSLTELFSPNVISERVSGMLRHYDFVSCDTLAYFTARPEQAKRDSDFALDYVSREARTAADQRLVMDALRFKCDVLWTQLDALWMAYVEGKPPPGAWQPAEQALSR